MIESERERGEEICGIAVRRISDRERWNRLRPEWDALFESSPSAAPPLRWEWLHAWWEVYGPAYVDAGGGRVEILAIYREGRLIGGLPLYRTRVGYASRAGGASWGYRRLGFPGTDEANFECLNAEYLDLLYAPGEAAACSAVLATELQEAGPHGWDELRLNNLTAASPLLPVLRTAHEGGRVAMGTPQSCPIADLTGGFEAYLDRLSSKRRGQFRRLLRDAARVGAVFEVATGPDEALAYYRQLAELHQRRWNGVGAPGCFAAPRFVQFHRELVRSWVPNGWAVLCRLCLDGRPRAVLYGFRVRDKFDFYQSGVAVEPAAGLDSPGIAALLLLFQHLAGRGVNCFDFLAGASYYKTRMATGERAVTSLTVRRATVRMGAYQTLDFIRRGVGKVRRATGRLMARDGETRSSPVEFVEPGASGPRTREGS